VLVHDGAVLGELPPVNLELPWWPEVRELVEAVRERDGLQVSVLRLLRTASDRIAGGHVTYLAETDRRPDRPLPPWAGDPLAAEPHRQLWARPGGPRELLDWADQELARCGLRRMAAAQQMRTSNLSAIWTISTTAGRIWLKAVPDFFAHEGAVIDWIGTPVAPPLYGQVPGRVLMGDISGVPNHEVSGFAALEPMVELLTGLQRRALDRLDDLRAQVSRIGGWR
jgi:hypothetical protein